jgi:hypothetical protein
MARLFFAVAGLLLTACAAYAETGIRFDAMPVGCRITGQYGSGEVVVDAYVGRKGKSHIVRTFGGPDGTDLIRTTTYNAAGLMIRKDWAGGAWETFEPYSCFNVPGACSYRYRNGDGADKIFTGQVKRTTKGVRSTGGFEGEPQFSPATVTFGPFGDQASYRDASSSFRVTAYVGCNLSG